MPEKDKNHFVPAFYLRLFHKSSGKNSSFFYLDKNIGKIFPSRANKECRKSKHYWITSEDKDPLTVENAYESMEANIAPRIRDLSKIKCYPEAKLLHPAIFLISMIEARSLRIRQMLDTKMSDILTKSLGILLHESGDLREKLGEKGQNKMQELYQQGILKPKISKDFLIASEMQSFKPIFDSNMQRNWSFFRTTNPEGDFITSDHPVILDWRTPEDVPGKGIYSSPGYALSRTIVYFPLSKNLLMMGVFEDDLPDYAEIENPSIIGSMNNYIFERCEKRIFLPRENVPFLDENGEVINGTQFQRKLRYN